MISSDRLLRIIGRLCNWTWRHAAHIVVLSNGFRRLLIKRGIPEERLTVIPNWADETGVAALDSTPLPPVFTEPGKFRVLFAGNMGPAQALDAVLDAAVILAKKRPEAEILFLGSGLEADRLKRRADDESIGNVHFLARVPMTDVGAYLAAADCLLVHLKADPLFAITIPSKTQAYMAAGKPIIMAVRGDAAELVVQSEGGVVVPPEDAQALADAVAELAALDPHKLAMMGSNARRFYQTHLSFEEGTRNLAKILKSVSGEGREV